LNCTRDGKETLAELLRRPEVTYNSLAGRDRSLPSEVTEQVEILLTYAGYISRQQVEIDKLASLESKRIPDSFDYGLVPSLRNEARQKLAKIPQPLAGGKPGRWNQDKIRLAGKNFKTKFAQRLGELVPRCDNFFEVRSVISQVLQSRQGGDLAQAIDVVAVAKFIQSGDQFARADKIAHPLKAEGVGLRKCSRESHVR